MEVSVIKRDGHKEPFTNEKIVRVVKAAGLSDKKIAILTSQIDKWLSESKKTEVSSLEIRDHVIHELTKIDTYVANMFIWYQKTKEK